ncbi:hypothetical protein CHS0354_015818 [Potamilus streckersoni]|uniref:Uncharacterized protein n=1 Tax=Potamilus streckersoni TaxID=2493646 RepID=A0AAE0VT99_9BIVA|nr:hypothetical protein CHS0354_015818 [Potamilus streckersoni]
MASVAKWNQEFIDSSGVFDINNRSNGLEAFNDIPSWEATEVPDRKNSVVAFSNVSSLNYKPQFPVSSISNGDLKPRETTNTVFNFNLGRSQEMSQSRNRYRQNSNDSDEECVARQHLKHVHENPFNSESDSRHLFRDSSKFGNNETDSVDNEEYHVNSGFVNKLRSRFAKLENKNLHTISLSKRSASVETLFASHYTPKTKSKFSDDVNRGWEQKRKSIDDIGIVKPKENVTSVADSVTKPPPVPKRRNESETKKRPESTSVIESVKPKQPVHPQWTIAPDLNIGRDDIVIIESAPKPSQKDVADEDIKSTRHSKEERIIANEFPKPKTVSSVRLYFEAVQSQADSTGSLFKRDSVSPPTRLSSSPTRHSLGSNSPQILISPFSFRSPLAKKQDDNTTCVFNYTNPSNENVEKASSPTIEQTEHVREEKTEPVANVLSKWESHSTNTAAEIRREKPVLKRKPELKPRVHNFISVKKDQEPDVKVSEVIKPVPETKESKSSTSEANVSQVSKPEEISKLEIKVSQVIKPEERISKPETDVLKESKPDEGNKPDKQLLLINTGDALTPVPTMSKVFDSKSIVAHSRTPRSNKPSAHVSEPKVQVNSDHNITQNNEVQSKSVKMPDQSPSTTEKILIPYSPVEETFKNTNLLNKERASKPKEIVPSKTIIFDSTKIKKAKKPVPKRPVSPPKSATDIATASFQDAKERTSSPERSQSDTSNVKPVKPPRMSRLDNAKVSVNISHDVNNVPKSEKSISSSNFKTEDIMVSSVVEKQYDSPNETVVRGIPSFLAEKLRKSSEQNNTGLNALNMAENPDYRQLKTKSSHLENGSSSPVPKKKQAQDVSSLIESSSPTVLDQRKPSDSPIQRSNIDDLISRKKPASYGNPICVFDSSKIATKRKDLPKRKPPKKSVQEINSSLVGLEPLTPLDLSSITNDTPDTSKQLEYQEGYIATALEPCPYVFEGAGVMLNHTPLRKTKQLKLKLQFNDTATSTYEYEAEELALERYLVDHPDEKAEVEKEKLEILAMESSSSSTDEPDTDIHHGKEVVKAVSLKTNTVLTAGGSLSNYKSKMQVDFKFGIDHQEEPEPEEVEEEPIDLNSQQLLPAQESELEAFSAEAQGRASDMLF